MRISDWSSDVCASDLFGFGPALEMASLDGQTLAAATLRWRGPLAFLRWRDAGGQGGWLVWWPDTLPAAARRVLRIAASAAPAHGGMAPYADVQTHPFRHRPAPPACQAPPRFHPLSPSGT